MMLQLPQLRLHWLDGSGSVAETRMTIGSMLSVSAIEAAVTSFVTAVSAVSNAAFTGYDIVYSAVPASYASAGIDSDVLRCGVFIYENSALASMGLVEVHAIKDDLLETVGPAAGILIDMADSRVVDFSSALSDIGATNPLGEALGMLVTAYRQSRA